MPAGGAVPGAVLEPVVIEGGNTWAGGLTTVGTGFGSTGLTVATCGSSAGLRSSLGFTGSGAGAGSGVLTLGGAGAGSGISSFSFGNTFVNSSRCWSTDSRISPFPLLYNSVYFSIKFIVLIVLKNSELMISNYIDLLKLKKTLYIT
jgi:hypothetical protein